VLTLARLKIVADRRTRRRRGSQQTRWWREKDSNPRSPFLDTHLLNALALGAAGLAYVSYEQLCCYAGGESRLSR